MISASIKDVAAHSGVSYKTVSRVINGEGSVREETRQRVLDAIEALDYRPHEVARSLRRGRANALRFVPAHPRDTRFLTNPFLDGLISGIVDTARRAEYGVMLEFMDSESDGPSLRERLRSRSVDGNVVLDSRVPFPLEDELRQSGVPSAVISNADLDPVLGFVHANFIEGGRQMVEHLIGLGHRRIAHIADDPILRSSFERVRGYREALEAHGIEYDPELTIMAGQMRHQGSAATQALLDQGIDFTAIYCVNDLTALGAIETLTRNGLRVPDDVSVTGYDDLSYAQYVVPALTTVHVPWYEMGVTATTAVIDTVEGRRSEPVREVLPMELRLRDSTGPVGRGTGS